MFGFLANNWGTILIFILMAALVTAIVVKLIRDKRKGKMIICDCGCKNCSKSSACNTK